MKHRYNTWKPKENSRRWLIISNDNGNRYEKVAVFSNEESVDTFETWIAEVVRESRELVEQKHGHWIESGDGLMCSECNHYTETTYYEPFNNEFGRGWALKRPYYCGYCGAKMDGEGREDETD